MMQVSDILRHPLKSHGREALTGVGLIAGEAMPWDRVWAVAHAAARLPAQGWAPCANFSRGSKAPELLAISARFDPATETLTLSHPERPALTFRPDTDGAAFLEWVMPLVPRDRALPERIVRLDGRGYTDSDFPSVTLCNRASHAAVEAQIGQPLSIHRWRGNIWIRNADPWQERDWIGRDIIVGKAVLRVREHTDRCLATTANPETGKRDADILGTLDHWGHRDFGVRAEVIADGRVDVGDTIEVS